jgi:hypothetical protein
MAPEALRSTRLFKLHLSSRSAAGYVGVTELKSGRHVAYSSAGGGSSSKKYLGAYDTAVQAAVKVAKTQKEAAEADAGQKAEAELTVEAEEEERKQMKKEEEVSTAISPAATTTSVPSPTLADKVHALKQQLALPADASLLSAIQKAKEAVGVEIQGSMLNQVDALLVVTGIMAVAGAAAGVKREESGAGAEAPPAKKLRVEENYPPPVPESELAPAVINGMERSVYRGGMIGRDVTDPDVWKCWHCGQPAAKQRPGGLFNAYCMRTIAVPKTGYSSFSCRQMASHYPAKSGGAAAAPGHYVDAPVGVGLS